jgi:hypothetical protein
MKKRYLMIIMVFTALSVGCTKDITALIFRMYRLIQALPKELM